MLAGPVCLDHLGALLESYLLLRSVLAGPRFRVPSVRLSGLVWLFGGLLEVGVSCWQSLHFCSVVSCVLAP